MSTKGQEPHGRRAQRTRALLQQAILDLLTEKGYEAISVQDIADRAQVGRTTFYLYFESKDDLYLSAHIDSMTQLGWQMTMDTLLAAEPPEPLLKFVEAMAQGRVEYLDVSRSHGGHIFFRRMQEHQAQAIEQCLRTSFQEQTSKVPFTVLANYLAGAEIALIRWWLENHPPVSAEQIAATFQTLQRAALRDALALN